MRTENLDVNEFQMNGKIYVAVEEKSCAGCAFGMGGCMGDCPSFNCSESTREDGRSVIFVEKGAQMGIELKNIDMPTNPCDAKALYDACTMRNNSYELAALGMTKGETVSMHIMATLVADPQTKLDEAGLHRAAECAVRATKALFDIWGEEGK